VTRRVHERGGQTRLVGRASAGSHGERASPNVGGPVTDCLDASNQVERSAGVGELDRRPWFKRRPVMEVQFE